MPAAIPTKLKNDYHVLTLSLPSNGGAAEATHTLYARKHAPRIPTPNDSRALYVSNVPVDATEATLRTLFTALGGGKVESVSFEDSAPTSTSTSTSTAITPSKKRKRDDDEDEVADLKTWDRTLHRSGTNCIVYFVDDASRSAALRALAKSRKSPPLEWSSGAPALGVARYAQHHRLRFPNSAALQESVDAFMAAFEAAEEEARRAASRRRQEPDADGFVTVVGRGRAVPQEAAKAALQKQEEKNKDATAGFYRFQVREEKKKRQMDLLAKFEEDRKRVEERKKGRTFRPE
jgi:ribosomal RNA-processing protein 7